MKLENIKEIIKHNKDGVLDGGSFKPDHLIQMTFGVIPHTFKSSLTYDTKIIELFEKDYELITQSHRIDNDKKLSIREKQFIKFQNEGAICLTLSTNTEVQWPKGKGNISSDKIDEILENPKILGSVGIMVTYDSSNESEVFELMESLNQYEYKNEDVTMSQIYLVSQDRNGFDLEEFDINNPELELELNYGSEFVPISDKIVSELNKDNNRG